MNAEDLIDFEEDIAQEFDAAKIQAPVHLYSGNEHAMIEAFKEVRTQDWVFCTWRSHYQCLLKGVPPEELKQAIMEGKSISLCFPEHKIYSSAIVGGSIPIALGTAFGIKRQGKDERVFCFLGDMAAESGIFAECSKYASLNNLPIQFIIEDNGLSVCTPTVEAWQTEPVKRNIKRYSYSSKWPHAGAGKRVQF